MTMQNNCVFNIMVFQAKKFRDIIYTVSLTVEEDNHNVARGEEDDEVGCFAGKKIF